MYYLVFFVSIYPYRFIAIRKSPCFYYVLLPGKRTKKRASEYNASLLANCKRAQPILSKSPGTRGASVVTSFVQEFPYGKYPSVGTFLATRGFRVFCGCCETRSVSYALRI